MTLVIHEVREGAEQVSERDPGRARDQAARHHADSRIDSVMTHDSQRQHLFGAELAVPPTAWAHAVDVVIAPMIDNIGRPGMQFRTRAAFRDALLRKLASGAFRVEHSEDPIEESP